MHQIISGDLISVILRRNYTFLCCPSYKGAHHRLHQNILREMIGLINFTSVTPENSQGINCVILAGPMVIPLHTKYSREIFLVSFHEIRGPAITSNNSQRVSHVVISAGGVYTVLFDREMTPMQRRIWGQPPTPTHCDVLYVLFPFRNVCYDLLCGKALLE